MAKLSAQQKRFVVERLACFAKPKDVAEEWADYFDEAPPAKATILYYDPTKAQGGRELAKDLQELFWATRDRFLKEIGDVPIANLSYRLLRYQRLAERAEEMRNLVLAGDMYERAAKDLGGMFTNRRLLEHTGKDGGPIQSESKVSGELAMLPTAELLKRRAELLRAAAEEAE